MYQEGFFNSNFPPLLLTYFVKVVRIALNPDIFHQISSLLIALNPDIDTYILPGQSSLYQRGSLFLPIEWLTIPWDSSINPLFGQ